MAPGLRPIRRINVATCGSRTPFHPLRGKQFDLVEHRCIYAESYLFFYDPFGRLLQIPAVWTDFLKTDAFVEAAVGRSPLPAGSLLELAELLKQLRKERSDDVSIK